MALKVGELYGVLSIDKKGFDKGLSGGRRAFLSFGNVLKVGALGIAAALAGITVAAGKMAIDFQKDMANVQTLLGKGSKAEARIGELKEDVKSISFATGKPLSDLTGGLYQVVSAFGDTADTAKLLDIAARASTAGLATTQDSVNLLSAVTKGYGNTSARAAQKASDLAFVTVKLGQTSFPELAASMGKAIPTAVALGVKQRELFAIMATATGVTGNTAEVSTQLKAAQTALIKPNATMNKLLKETGFQSGKALVKQKGLVGAWNELNKVAKGNQLAEAAGSTEALNLALALTGSQASDFKKKYKAMGDVTGATNEAFDIQQKTVSAMWGRIEAGAGVLLVTLGEKFLPILESVLSFVLDNWPKLEEMFDDVFTTIGEVVGPVVDFFTDLIDSFKSTEVTANGVYKEIDGLTVILDTLSGIFDTMNETILPVFQKIFDGVVGTITALGDAIRVALDEGGIEFGEILDWIGDEVMPVVSDGLETFTGIVGTLFDALQEVIGILGPVFGAALKLISEEVLPHVRSGLGFISETVLPAFKTAFDGAASLIDRVWPGVQTVVETVGAAIETVIGVVQPLVEGLGAAFSLVKGVIVGALGTIKTVWNTAKGFFQGVWDGITSVIKGAVNTIIDMLNTMSSAFAFSAKFEIPSFDIPDPTQLLEGGTIKIGGGAVDFSRGPLFDPIPRLAAGTPFFGGGLARLGELGPELAFLPRGAQVLRADQTRELVQAFGRGGSNGGVTIGTQNIHGFMPDEVEIQTRRAMRRDRIERDLSGR